MMAVFDTALVIDYLRGVKRALEAFGQFPDRAITVGTWVEVMSEAPSRLEPQTREFLRGFERLAINEAIADRALALMQQHDGLNIPQALAGHGADQQFRLRYRRLPPPARARSNGLRPLRP